MYVHLTVPQLASHARTVISDELRQVGRAEMPMAFLPAAYSFQQLEEWLFLVLERPVPALVYAEIDERRNRLSVGIDNLNARSELLAILQAAQVPLEAVGVQHAQRPTLLQSLHSYIRPLGGGTRIIGTYAGYNPQGFCTYGINAWFNGSRHMVVNSHCTQNEDTHGLGGWVGSNLYQPTAHWLYLFGNEIFDPPFTAMPGCGSDHRCRWSDAALVQVTTSDGWDLGGILRPINRVFLPTIVGSFTINSSNPRIRLHGTTGDFFVGDVLDKVGQRTGWTAGTVESTCRYIPLSTGAGTFGLICSGVVRAGVGAGDSSAPVFLTTQAGNNLLVGMVFAGFVDHTGLGEEYYFSRWEYINWELASGSLIAIPSGGSDPPPDDPPCVPDPPWVECPV